MEKKQGRVCNYVVSDVDEFLDTLEKELCQSGGSYVRYNNEVHCFDKIFRFYGEENFRRNFDIPEFVEGEGSLRLNEKNILPLKNNFRNKSYKKVKK